MNIKLSNGTELTAIKAQRGRRTLHGTERSNLSMTFSAEKYGLDELDSAFSADNCESITLVHDDGAEDVYTGYTMRQEITKFSVVVEVETPESCAMTEERITVSMSQRTYLVKSWITFR